MSDKTRRDRRDLFRGPWEAERPDNSAAARIKGIKLGRRALLAIAAVAPNTGEIISGDVVPTTSPTAVAPITYTPAELQDAVECYVGRFVVDDEQIPITKILEDGSTIKTTANKWHDMLERLLVPGYAERVKNPDLDQSMPLAESAAKAIPKIEVITSEYAASWERHMRLNRFMLQHPHALGALANAIDSDPRVASWPDERSVSSTLEFLKKLYSLFPSEVAIANSVRDNLGWLRDEFNEKLYGRFGTMLPGTSDEDRKRILESIKKDMADNGFSDDVYSQIVVRRFAEDGCKQGDNYQPTYLMSLKYEEDNTPEESRNELNALLAGIAEKYPTDTTLFSDDMNLVHSIPAGMLRLTLLDGKHMNGVLITFPKGYERTQLRLMEDYLAREVVKSASHHKYVDRDSEIIR